MAEYRLYCFGESGNAYKAALMLALYVAVAEQPPAEIHVELAGDDELHHLERRAVGLALLLWTLVNPLTAVLTFCSLIIWIPATSRERSRTTGTRSCCATGYGRTG